MPRHFLDHSDFDRAMLERVFRLADNTRLAGPGDLLARKVLGILFLEESTRQTSLMQRLRSASSTRGRGESSSIPTLLRSGRCTLISPRCMRP